MAVVLLFLMVVAFVAADVGVRVVFRKREEARIRRDRKEALEIGVRLAFAEVTPSLKRVQVKEPVARILAVDDEHVVLDSFRKILVLGGYSIDTVVSGPEALTLVKNNDYDFVFTDLRMPHMDGIEVVKAVRHLRPDIDVVIITGYASIESAVETMKFGAVDYVQKPFTDEELLVAVKKLAIQRQDRITRRTKPMIHLVTSQQGESATPRDFNVLPGLFVSPVHTWVRIEANGLAHVGVDDFIQKLIAPIEGIDLPQVGSEVKAGATLFVLRQGKFRIEVSSPIKGKVSFVNNAWAANLPEIKDRPYDSCWVCAIEATDLSQDLKKMKIGSDTISWYQGEVEKYMKLVESHDKSTQESVVSNSLNDFLWMNAKDAFFGGMR